VPGGISPTEILKGILRASVGRIKELGKKKNLDRKNQQNSYIK